MPANTAFLVHARGLDLLLVCKPVALGLPAPAFHAVLRVLHSVVLSAFLASRLLLLSVRSALLIVALSSQTAVGDLTAVIAVLKIAGGAFQHRW